MFLNVQFTVQKYNHCFSDKFRVEASVYQENHDVHDVYRHSAGSADYLGRLVIALKLVEIKWGMNTSISLHGQAVTAKHT